ADEAVAMTPHYPGGAPLASRHPTPTGTADQRPAAVVIAAPTEWLVLADPKPTGIIGERPVPGRIRAPIERDLCGLPARTVVRDFDPLAVRGQIVVEIVGGGLGVADVKVGI